MLVVLMQQPIACPNCRCSEILRWGKRGDRQRYRCKACQVTFYKDGILRNTPFRKDDEAVKGHFISVRVTAEVGSRIEALQQSKRVTLSEVVTELLELGLKAIEAE